jgi:hypothetical protein
MRLRSTIPFIALVFSALPVHAADHVLTVVNDDAATVTSVSYSPPGSDRWFVMGGGPIEAGTSGQARIAMPPSACVFDFRVRFEGHPAQDIKAWNVCRGQALHIGTAPSGGQL